MTMLLTFEIIGRARNHGNKFLNLGRTSFSGIVNCCQIRVLLTFETFWRARNRGQKFPLWTITLKEAASRNRNVES